MNPRYGLEPKLPKFGKTCLIWPSDSPNQRARVPAYWSTEVVGISRPAPDVVGLVHTNYRILTVHILSLDRATYNKVMTSPAMIGAVAVAGQRPAEVGCGESCYLVAQAEPSTINPSKYSSARPS